MKHVIQINSVIFRAKPDQGNVTTEDYVGSADVCRSSVTNCIYHTFWFSGESDLKLMSPVRFMLK